MNQEFAIQQQLMINIQLSLEDPTCEDFASILGFQDTSSHPMFSHLSEDNKILAINLMQDKFYNRVGSSQQKIVSFKFSALYLPELVKRILNPPGPSQRSSAEDFKLVNAYLHAFTLLGHTPYLAKYFRSQENIAKEGKDLMPVLAERLLHLAPRLEVAMTNNPDHDQSLFHSNLVGSSVEILGDLLNIFIKEPKGSRVLLPQETKQALIPCLKKWEKYFGATVDRTLAVMCMRTRSLLEGNVFQTERANRLRKELKNWEHCGKPGCESTSKLKACGRCQTVRYCCAEHQKIHWKLPEAPHKVFCFNTVY